jgi:hypothetical protein
MQTRAPRKRSQLHARTVVVVEGSSDAVALRTLARRRGRDLDAEGVSIIAIGGAQSIGNFLRELKASKPGVRLAGLCDAGETEYFRRALEEAGLGINLTGDTMEGLGFFVCEADLEDELIRALTPAGVERVIEAQDDLRSFQSFQQQPAQQGRTPQQQLRRFMGTKSGRKARYAHALVDALDLTKVPHPLDRLLAHL